MISKLLKLFKKEKKCNHEGIRSHKWLSKDRTPMVYSHCDKCGYTDKGHVYANPDTYLEGED